jgi:hypothetical protein
MQTNFVVNPPIQKGITMTISHNGTRKEVNLQELKQLLLENLNPWNMWVRIHFNHQILKGNGNIFIIPLDCS